MTEEKGKKVEKKNLVGTRGRIFQGRVIKKLTGRITIEFERSLYIKKYERFYKKKVKIHARVPEGMEVEVGDVVRVQECRPLSKIIHAIVIEKVNGESKEEKK